MEVLVSRIRLMSLSVLAAGVLVVGACSSDSDDSADDAPATTAAATTDDTAMGDGMMDETIVDVAASNPDFSTLVELVTAAGLGETLSGEGPFTVFAPTDEAFEAVDPATLESLGADTDALTAVLTYHVVPASVMAADLTDGQVVETVQGGTFTVNITDEGVTLTDGAGQTINVIDTDLEASNGVIHVIDGVLLPGDPATLLGG
jgi:uncharacterized surface protein with fasciclin (FAS1) repeats